MLISYRLSVIWTVLFDLNLLHHSLALRMPQGGLQQAPFSARANHPASYNESPSFLGCLPAVIDEANARQRLRLIDIGEFNLVKKSSTKKVLWKVGEALVGAIDAKEYFEACEFYLRTRKRVKRQVMIDACCGHGLVGLLFAACEPSVEAVVLVDVVKPPSFGIILAAITEVAPWTSAKVSFVENDFRELDAFAHLLLPQKGVPDNGLQLKNEPTTRLVASRSVGVLGIHACGRFTDDVIGLACNLGAVLAVMPCCYTGTASSAPFGVRRALGVGLAADVDRSYRLGALGYNVDWSAIPSEITPMNRILIGEPKNSHAGDKSA